MTHTRRKVGTRWHIDDVLGRFLEREKKVRVLRYPALAERDSKFRKQGEALFPEFKSLAFLHERQRIISQASWEAEYQQTPILVGDDAAARAVCPSRLSALSARFA